MSETKPQQLSPSERVAKSRALAVQRGGRRLPNSILPPDAAAALDRLQAIGYAESASACIARALVEASAAISSTR